MVFSSSINSSSIETLESFPTEVNSTPLHFLLQENYYMDFSPSVSLTSKTNKSLIYNPLIFIQLIRLISWFKAVEFE
uniref:Uncharacterized protein n=1 Tax=Lepeophtheirus salmonis TaxID=72036 RepID=A0A0K2V7J8_LEPSM